MPGSSGNEGGSVFKFGLHSGFIHKTIAIPDCQENRALLRQLQEIANRDFISKRSKKGALNLLTLQAWADFRDQHYKGNPQKLLEVKPELSEETKGRLQWSNCPFRVYFRAVEHCKPHARAKLVKVGPGFVMCAKCTKKYRK